MEIKKTSKANLENKRWIFFLAGLSISSLIFYFIMEWKIEKRTNKFDSEELATLIIEKEFNGENLLMAPLIEKSEPQQKEKEKIVYEDFNITDKSVENQDTMPPVSLDKILSEEIKTISIADNTEKHSESAVLTEAEIMPQFPGGKSALALYISRNIKYPEAAIKQKKQGRVWCSFIVNEDGTVSDVKLEEGIYIFLDDEALRVLQTMPPWVAGEKNGEKVRIKVYLPVVFKI
ncbi:MAG: energy transducer TonB [Dysgonamonadaceae bacterium]|jgi:protein TonB|nr:energy transducer TonB [Dysgonamonadaceae bacterium]